MQGKVWAGRREGVGPRRRKQHARAGPHRRLGARARAERTRNIWFMLVTPEVSQLEMSASKFCEFWKRELMVVTLDVFQLEMSALKLFNLWKSQLMSVMADTHKSAMGPYVAMAAAGSALNASTAVRREALVVKVAGQVPGPQLEP